MIASKYITLKTINIGIKHFLYHLTYIKSCMNYVRQQKFIREQIGMLSTIARTIMVIIIVTIIIVTIITNNVTCI